MDLKGKAHKFGDDINTDYIMSSRHRTQTLDYAKLAEHLMGDIRPGFYAGVRPGDFIVAGTNFGCGSSREYAPKIIKAGGIAAILAKTFARIFYRNAINLGLPLMECDTDLIEEGDVLRVNLDGGRSSTKPAGGQFRPTPCLSLWLPFSRKGERQISSANTENSGCRRDK